MNADFFTQLQRIRAAKHQEAVRDVVRDIVQVYGSNFTLTLEEYFTQLESMRRIVRLANHSVQGFSPKELDNRRDALMSALAAVLEVSTDVSRKDTAACEHHTTLVGALDPRDTVITFNYDCVMDHALRTHGGGKWSARYGYSLPRPSRIEGTKWWDASPPASSARRTINLLKLHGSINWQLPPLDAPKPLHQPIKLKQRLYQQRGTPRFTIIPPEWAKNIEDQNFRVLWQNAERAIHRAKTLAFVGFSFTPTDLHVESLFRLGLARNRSLRDVIIANPNQEHRRRVRAVISQALTDQVAVRQYSGLEELAAAIQRSGL